MSSPVSPVAIIGSGPHGLAMALHLERADPELARGLVVIDPSGDWMTTWADNFRRLDIDVLRSPSVHHPGPDVGGLSSFVFENGLATSRLPYDPPCSEPFLAFCHSLVDATPLPRPIAQRPSALRPHADGLTIDLESGRTLVAERVVVASNPHRREVPQWVTPLLGRTRAEILHGDDVDLIEASDLTGRRVAVIGGGLTAGHLACGAADRGADVTVITRRPVTARSFDTEPGWLGPKFLRGYDQIAAPEERLEAARAARGGGTMPEWMVTRVHDADLRLCENDPVRVAEPSERACRLRLESGAIVEVDAIWLATGSRPDIAGLRALRPLLPDIATVDGLPVPDDDLRIGRHPIHVMGRLAMLRLGPASGNLWGARIAARRITRAITGVDVESQVPPTAIRTR
ncbi:MAG: FAD-dependent oxidoreductase [Actinomycetota bacterium]